MHNERGIAIKLKGNRKVERAAKKIADMLVSGKAGQVQVMGRLYETSVHVRKSMLMCDLHKRLEPTLNLSGCRVCET
jgi:hypothetical protein